jgi:hypothetical protein
MDAVEMSLSMAAEVVSTDLSEMSLNSRFPAEVNVAGESSVTAMCPKAEVAIGPLSPV